MPKIQGGTRRKRVTAQDIVAQAAENLSDDALDCRTMGHSWRAYDAAGDEVGWYVIRQCRRCRTRRNLQLDTEGYLASSSYTYPSERGYQIRGAGHLSAADNAALRVAWCRRATSAPTLRAVR